eukprot:scaffold91512_cov18-Tisochrysis_lutea.AAC.2
MGSRHCQLERTKSLYTFGVHTEFKFCNPSTAEKPLLQHAGQLFRAKINLGINTLLRENNQERACMRACTHTHIHTTQRTVASTVAIVWLVSYAVAARLPLGGSTQGKMESFHLVSETGFLFECNAHVLTI